MAVQQRKSGNKKKSVDVKEESSNAANSGKRELSQSQKIQGDASGFKMPWTKIASRFLLSMLMIFAVYWTSKKDTMHVFASQKQRLQLTSAEVSCSSDYLKDVSKFKACAPKHCGRLVTDIVITPEEAAHLLRVAKKGLAFGGSYGGASILDLHSGALSYENSFINIYQKLKALDKNIFTADDFKVYRNVRNKIQQIIAYNFGINANKLHLTHPTFFSEMTPRAAKTKHDEYWHVHVDKETYPSFHYTSLLYLADYGADFTGGRFIFVDEVKNMTIEPRVGRVSAFTSGAENPHFVEPVSSGTRYALTVSFSCDPDFGIADPNIEKLK
ncbi:2-oxoglutarate and iron-dependent oxygenase domain-containing protein 3-like isoform X1 [Stegodyphus dumicola]|uniref:2-oxoglutarate and iron-dependent oxygenase domain-containing protein 3-like isoform X1 n=2 Tax=Stegodyphus dumicola TaxID=202533 RepID=UPI0015AB773F|nr:2-oxoglutarate and iron-dependent oxygenase domain-containing protein 3-like isoform X1 [Stegodyphus dumicola]